MIPRTGVSFREVVAACDGRNIADTDIIATKSIMVTDIILFNFFHLLFRKCYQGHKPKFNATFNALFVIASVVDNLQLISSLLHKALDAPR